MIWAEVGSQRVGARSRTEADDGGPGHPRMRVYYMGLWDPDSGYKYRDQGQPGARSGRILGDGRQGPDTKAAVIQELGVREKTGG